METIKRDEIILRFENFYENYERNDVTKINLDGMFKDFKILSLTEMNLSANQPLKEKQLWEWSTMENNGESHDVKREFPDHFIVNIKPMEIRTFVAKIEKLSMSMSAGQRDILENSKNEMYVAY